MGIEQMIDTPYGKKPWADIKRAMDLEVWVTEHVLRDFFICILEDLGVTLGEEPPSKEDLDKVISFMENHQCLGHWIATLQEALLYEPKEARVLQ